MSLVDKRCEMLGKTEDNPNDASHDPEGNLTARVPGEYTTTEVDSDNPAGHSSVEEKQSEPIHLLQFLGERSTPLEIDVWEEKQISGSEDGTDDKVDVE